MADDTSHLTPDQFVPLKADTTTRDALPAPALSYGRNVMRRLRRDPAALVCVIVLVIIALGALIAPFFCPFDYATQNVAFANKPFMSVDPLNGMTHILGTDYLGRDVFARIWFGARISLMVALAAALIDCVVGVVYGGISGYFGGRVDNVMMRVLEVISGVPYMVVVLLLTAVLPRGIGTLILAYSLVGWTSLARLVRGQSLALRNREFMVAARIMGASARRSITRHLLPNLMGLIVVNITLDIPNIIFTEAFLSLLGLGVPPPFPSLGAMVSDGIVVFQTQPMQLVVPALFICTTMLAFNLLGDRLQDALDPKQRRLVGFGKRARHKKAQRSV